MGRISKTQYMLNNENLIFSYFEEYYKSIFTLDQLIDILTELKENKILMRTTKLNELVIFLYKRKILDVVNIQLPQRSTTRYIFGDISPLILGLSLNKKAYLSHFSAVFIHNLTENVPKTIYINAEQADKHMHTINQSIELEQKNIDLAFSRPMRQTNQIAQFKLKTDKYNVYMLNGKNHNRLGVINQKLGNDMLPVTSIERTLIDITVRPNYAGGVNEVLSAYKNAKGKFSVNALLSMYKKMNFIYPYHQLIGFYLEQAKYPESAIKLLNQFEFEFDFYLTYQMRDKEYSPRWRVYCPKGFNT